MEFDPVGLDCALSGVVAQQVGDRVVAPYMAGTVRVSAQFENGETTEGFGFIVGEREGDLFLVTANHVIERGPDPAETIEVRFRAAADVPLRAQRLRSNAGLDLALLKLDAPRLAKPWQPGFWCAVFQRGDKVWFIAQSALRYAGTEKMCADEPMPSVIRGGSWVVPPQGLRPAYRTWDSSDYRYDYVGFRVVRVAGI